MNNAMGQVVTILTAIIGVAILSVIVSKKAQTPEVLDSFFGGFSKALSAATSPVTGGFGSQF